MENTEKQLPKVMIDVGMPAHTILVRFFLLFFYFGKH